MSEFDADEIARSTDEESDIARVLRAAGGRAKPSDELRRSVRAAVHAEWSATVGKRAKRRVGLAIAATLVVAAVALWIGLGRAPEPGEVVASIGRAIGTVQSRSSGSSGWHSVNAATQAGATSAALRVGEDLMTGRDGRVALEMREGVSVRLDHDTQIAFVSPERIDVTSGGIYVDAGTAHSASQRLRVGTPAGVIEHVGTQYEARIVSGGTRIRVREGRVALVPERGALQSASIGEQLLVSPTGEIQRASIAPSDAAWAWAAEAAPTFDIDGRTVRDFLNWAGRELGREVVFATPESEAEARRAILRGSVAGLSPAEALAAVMPTTALRSVQRDDKIEIVLQTTH